MNYSEFTEYWATKKGVSKSEARNAIDTFVTLCKEAVHEYGKLSIKDFMTAEIKDKPLMKGIKRQTKEQVDIPAKRKVALKIAKSFEYMEENYLL